MGSPPLELDSDRRVPPPPAGESRLRRACDVGLAGVALALFLPVAAAIAVGIRCDSPGPVLHRARRVGRAGGLFTLYKFRTMVINATVLGPGVTGGDDPRITRMGRWLRAAKLDEWPQFINVVRGEMSLVGPRPEDPRYVAGYTPQQRRVLEATPGLISPATLEYRNEQELLARLAAGGRPLEAIYRQEVLPAKLRIDLDYLRQRNGWTDLRLIVQAALLLLRRPG